MKRTAIRPQSKKRAALNTQRRKMVKQLLDEFPVCQVPWCIHPSADVHEPLTRARGGSITDPDNAKAICRMHHDLIHAEPAWAYEEGFLKHSWDGS